MKYSSTAPFELCLEYVYWYCINNLNSGDNLPACNLFADKIGVNRTVLREVLRVLDFHGFVRIQHGKSTVFVSANRPSLVWQMRERGLLA